ncbi:MAG TPA: dethiobiotin synthase [Acidimicrobiales bacterium]|nr:dethiobiotin synthase [Acidimicrobiales bacterium]
MTVLFVAGTGTEVGKTWVACEVARAARGSGRRVAARKPAQSYDAGADGEPLAATDADLLGAASGEAPTTVCPSHRWYPVAMAPPMAADALDRPPVRLADLVAETTWPQGCDLVVVEAAGGVRSPIAHDGDGVDLAQRLAPDLVLLVADATLGTINLTRLSVDALTPLPVLVILNRYDDADDLQRRNRAWLEHHAGLDVVVHPADALHHPSLTLL